MPRASRSTHCTAVVAVVVDLLDGLLGDRREGGVARCAQPTVQLEQEVGGDELPGDGVREVAVGLFEQVRAAPGRFVAPVGQVVLALAGP